MTGTRQRTRERNRLILIDAVLDSIAENGVSETSVSGIVERAGLSRGMIHLHFGGKDNLVDEAARRSSETYYDQLDAAIESAGGTGQERIEMIIRHDLSEQVLNPKSIGIWYAFRGEARNRSVVAKYSDTRDAKLKEMIREAFMETAERAGCKDSLTMARDATHGLLAMLEGMWTDYLLHSDEFDRQEAARIVFRFLSALFPKHFDLRGAIDSGASTEVGG